MITMNENTTENNSFTFLKEGEALVEQMLYKVPLEELVENPDQPRKYFDAESLNEMGSSVKEHGVIQPVIVQKDESGQLVIVSGERRYRAAKQAGLEDIPAIYYGGADRDVIALVENLMREDLTAIEEAEALHSLKEQRNYTQEQISGVIGKAVPTISEILALAKLPEDIRNECRTDRRYSRRKLLVIARKESAEEMQKAFNHLKKDLDKSRSETPTNQVTDEVDQADVWIKRIDKFKASLEKADVSSLGDKRGDVEGALGVLLAVIKRILPEEA